MSHAESSSPSTNAVASSTDSVAARTSTKAHPARAFVIQLVACEIQLGPRRAGWLRAAAHDVSAKGTPELAAECVRLAAESWQQREQLVALPHRLVARWHGQSIDASELVQRPESAAMRAFIELHERAATSATPSSVLAALATVERLVASVVPFALEFTDSEDHDDLCDVVEFYRGRRARATDLGELVATLEANAPALAELAANAVDSFTNLNRESAELGRQLGNWLDR